MSIIQEKIAKSSKMVSVILFAACAFTIFAVILFLGSAALLYFSQGSLAASLQAHFIAESLEAGAGELSAKTLAMLLVFGAMQLVLLFSVLFVLRRIFTDIIRSYTPFEKKHAVSMKQVAVLILAWGVIGNVFDGVGQATVYETLMIDVNVTWLVLSIVIYCMAHIFDYGCQLQTLSDETL